MKVVRRKLLDMLSDKLVIGQIKPTKVCPSHVVQRTTKGYIVPFEITRTRLVDNVLALKEQLCDIARHGNACTRNTLTQKNTCKQASGWTCLQPLNQTRKDPERRQVRTDNVSVYRRPQEVLNAV